jgi:hypothetical protein
MVKVVIEEALQTPSVSLDLVALIPDDWLPWAISIALLLVALRTALHGAITFLSWLDRRDGRVDWTWTKHLQRVVEAIDRVLDLVPIKSLFARSQIRHAKFAQAPRPRPLPATTAEPIDLTRPADDGDHWLRK